MHYISLCASDAVEWNQSIEHFRLALRDQIKFRRFKTVENLQNSAWKQVVASAAAPVWRQLSGFMKNCWEVVFNSEAALEMMTEESRRLSHLT